ncbi:hypothetical protein QJR26_09535 [Clostridium baratii]
MIGTTIAGKGDPKEIFKFFERDSGKGKKYIGSRIGVLGEGRKCNLNKADLQFIMLQNKVWNKIYSYRFIIAKHKEDLISYELSSNKSYIDKLTLDNEVLVLINLYLKAFLRLENKERAIDNVKEIIFEFYKLFFLVDLKNFIKIIELVKYYGLEDKIFDNKYEILKLREEGIFSNKSGIFKFECYYEGIKIYYNNLFLVGYYNDIDKRIKAGN